MAGWPGSIVAWGNIYFATAVFSHVLTTQPTLAQQFATLANVTVLLSLYCYALVAVSLMRLGRGFSPGRRATATATAVVTIAASVGLAFTAKPVELAYGLLPPAAAALLYLWLRRR